MDHRVLPDPALVVLVGPSGSGKSTWASAHYRAEEIVSSDTLRGVVDSGPHDLEASADAFGLLETIVTARLGRGLTTVVDTLASDVERRMRWLGLARRGGLPSVVVELATPAAECRRRNAARDRPVPAAVLTQQLARHRATVELLTTEGWDVVHRVRTDAAVAGAPDGASSRLGQRGPTEERRSSQGLRIVLQLSRFPWAEDPARWLAEVAGAADEAGLAGIALMDHLIQIPQVDRAWTPIPEPWVTLGLLACLDTGLRLGTLVTPVTLRAPGITAKAAATLDVLSGGRPFVGVGAGWWEREHAAYDLPLPSARARLDALERGIETMRALWATGSKAYDGERVSLPETTCYPRPVGALPVIVGGSGARTLRIGARPGDAVNVPSAMPALDAHIAAVRAVSEDVAITVLDLPTLGRDRDDTWAGVERLRGRTAARPRRHTPPAPTRAQRPGIAIGTASSPTGASTPCSSRPRTSRDPRTSPGWPHWRYDRLTRQTTSTSRTQ